MNANISCVATVSSNVDNIDSLKNNLLSIRNDNFPYFSSLDEYGTYPEIIGFCFSKDSDILQDEDIGFGSFWVNVELNEFSIPVIL